MDKKTSLDEVLAFYTDHHGFPDADSPHGVNTRIGGETILILTVIAGRLEHVNILLQHGARINEADVMGFTALHNAAFYRRHEIARRLIANGALTGIKNEFGETPLDIAKKSNDREMTRILKGRG